MLACALRVTGTLPSFLKYAVALDVVPGFNVPQLTLESAVVHPLSEYTPNCNVCVGGGCVTTVILPLLERVRVVTSAPNALMTKPKTTIAKIPPIVALRIAITVH